MENELFSNPVRELYRWVNARESHCTFCQCLCIIHFGKVPSKNDRKINRGYEDTSLLFLDSNKHSFRLSCAQSEILDHQRNPVVRVKSSTFWPSRILISLQRFSRKFYGFSSIWTGNQYQFPKAFFDRRFRMPTASRVSRLVSRLWEGVGVYGRYPRLLQPYSVWSLI